MILTMRRLRMVTGLCGGILFSFVFFGFIFQTLTDHQLRHYGQLHGFPHFSFQSMVPTWGGIRFNKVRFSDYEANEVLSMEVLELHFSLKSILKSQIHHLKAQDLTLKTSGVTLKKVFHGFFQENSKKNFSFQECSVEGNSRILWTGEREEEEWFSLPFQFELKGDFRNKRTAKAHFKTNSLQSVLLCETDPSGQKMKIDFSWTPSPFSWGEESFIFPQSDASIAYESSYEQGVETLSFGINSKEKGTHLSQKSPFYDLNWKFQRKSQELLFVSEGKGHFLKTPVHIQASQNHHSLALKAVSEEILIKDLLTVLKMPVQSAEGSMVFDFEAKTAPMSLEFDRKPSSLLGEFVHSLLNQGIKARFSLKIKDMNLKTHDFEGNHINSGVFWEVLNKKGDFYQDLKAESIRFKGIDIQNIAFRYDYDGNFVPKFIHFTSDLGEFHMEGLKPEDGEKKGAFLLDVKRIDAQKFLEIFPIEGLHIQGEFDGHAEMAWEDSRRLKFRKGRLFSRSPEGFVRYTPSQSQKWLFTEENLLKPAEESLKNFTYSSFMIELEEKEEDKQEILLDIMGSNPDFSQGQPFRLKLKGLLPELMEIDILQLLSLRRMRTSPKGQKVQGTL